MRLRGKKDRLEEFMQDHPKIVVLDPAEHKGRWKEFFGNGRPIHAELGMGKGRFVTEMCAAQPGVNFIGIDMYDELVRRGTEKAEALMSEGRHPAAGSGAAHPPNLALVRYNIEQIDAVFAAGELERIYLNFSDPWPKSRHIRRRLTHPRFLRSYAEILNGDGEIHLKTDSRLLFEFSLNAFADMNLRMRGIRLDLHGEGDAPGNVMTEYESKFVRMGKPIHRVEAIVGADALRRHEDEVRKKLAREL